MSNRPRLDALVPAMVLALAMLASAAERSLAFENLTRGAVLKTTDKANPKSDKITFSFKNDAALLTIPESPLCPTASQIQILANNNILPALPLDCARWQIAGSGFRYRYKDPVTGGTQILKLRPGKLTATIKGSPYSGDPVLGPVTFVETRLKIGATEFCGRWSSPPGIFKLNQLDKVQVKGPTTACQASCGNTIVENAEQCDDGNLVNGDGCDNNCKTTACGNGVQTAGEDCDDGNVASGDGCRANCTLELCGDGIDDANEDCDDGNTNGGDCCSSSCGYESNGSPCDDDLNGCTDDTCNGAGTCLHTPNNDPCSDLDGCTIGDTCSAGSCEGELRAPWINEFDYDDFDPNAVFNDRDEFIEIAGPAGTDLSGYQILNIEGGLAGTCLTPHQPPQAAIGESNLLSTIPPGTVLQDDTGTGIGFYVACYTNTSIHVVNLPACDDVLPGPRVDSNLLNGHLLNSDEINCPDGLLLLDPDDNYVDAVSYEGVVPNVGTYGPFFHIDPPYSAPRDEGWLLGVSIEKTTSTLERAQNATEWIDASESPSCVAQGGINPPPACPTLLWSPGIENAQQTLECGSPCAAFIDAPGSLLE